MNTNETSTFTSLAVHEIYKINHQFNCNDKCLIYLIICKPCLKQYVGQTIDTFRFRMNNCKDNNRKFQHAETCIQEHFLIHFSSTGHNGFTIHCFYNASTIFVD